MKIFLPFLALAMMNGSLVNAGKPPCKKNCNEPIVTTEPTSTEPTTTGATTTEATTTELTLDLSTEPTEELFVKARPRLSGDDYASLDCGARFVMPEEFLPATGQMLQNWADEAFYCGMHTRRHLRGESQHRQLSMFCFGDMAVFYCGGRTDGDFAPPEGAVPRAFVGTLRSLFNTDFVMAVPPDFGGLGNTVCTLSYYSSCVL